jgi:hypothetical protein
MPGPSLIISAPDPAVSGKETRCGTTEEAGHNADNPLRVCAARQCIFAQTHSQRPERISGNPDMNGVWIALNQDQMPRARLVPANGGRFSMEVVKI